MGIFDFLFGGSDDSAQIAQLNTNAANTQLIRQLAERARSDVMEIFPQSQDIQRIGTQGALDVFGQTIPEQLQAFQGGNVAAQDTQRAALPQIQNALMGNPVDFNALQTFQPSLNTAFAQQNVPNFPDSQTAINNANNAPAAAIPAGYPTQAQIDSVFDSNWGDTYFNEYGGYYGPSEQDLAELDALFAPYTAPAPAPAPYFNPYTEPAPYVAPAPAPAPVKAQAPVIKPAPAPAPYFNPYTEPAPSFPPYVPPSVYLPQPRYTAPATNILTPNKIIAAAPQYGGLGGGY